MLVFIEYRISGHERPSNVIKWKTKGPKPKQTRNEKDVEEWEDIASIDEYIVAHYLVSGH